MVRPMGNFFTLHVITARSERDRPTESKRGRRVAREREIEKRRSERTKCLLCAEEQFNKISLA